MADALAAAYSGTAPATEVLAVVVQTGYCSGRGRQRCSSSSRQDSNGLRGGSNAGAFCGGPGNSLSYFATLRPTGRALRRGADIDAPGTSGVMNTRAI